MEAIDLIGFHKIAEQLVYPPSLHMSAKRELTYLRSNSNTTSAPTFWVGAEFAII